MLADRSAFRRRLAGLRRRAREGKPVDRGVAALSEAVEASRARLERRRLARPDATFPDELPVSARRGDIAEAIEAHQVVVIAGETGSGKTTQIPKICLQLGRGVAGLIGHTQPRRIAARSVARRIAEELGSSLGAAVGYKVRFTDQVGADSHIKLMTDGILLAEIQGDPLLEQYDTLIIDEAHERSLNIDFLLGYLKQLLPRRPDLKVVITSATINTEGIARFFDGAPVLEVSGRTYPVEVRYRPLIAEDEDERDRDLPQAIVEAVDEVATLDPLGDVLVFLPGEREIREAAEALRKHTMRHTEVIPLFSRLSTAEQDRVFQPHRGRRIVLATNVAETSLTVPGIRFVIDSGLARISRYSHRTKVQRLPIEPISQASANQRAGRCGRVSAGTCIRLYGKEDYQQRPLYTDPEVRRTNLASVILQMANLGLGDVERFPFMDPPDRRYVNDGYRLLQELQAVDNSRHLTDIGRKLVRLPVDPRIGRMLLAADREGSLEEVLVIASALSIQDPRLRPMDAQQKADQAHKEFTDPQSDFVAYLNLWSFYREQARHLSQSKLRALCHDRFLSYVRLREWHDIHGQLKALASELGLRPASEPAEAEAIHRALLTGLLGHVALKEEERSYLGARGLKLSLFPGSSLSAKPPKWIVAAELVETSRLFARTAAAIRPEWLEPLAGHLVKRNYFEPHWEKRPAQVAAFEQVTLYGLPLVARRRVNYGSIDPTVSREIFIRAALVEGEYRTDAPFFAHNRALLEEVETLEAKARRRDLMVDEQVLFDFYAERIPEGIYSGKGFERWRREAEREDPRLLFLSREALLPEAAEAGVGQFPDSLEVGGIGFPLEYRFEPGQLADGVTLVVPLVALNHLRAESLEWLVPGLLKEKLIALIKSLPKGLRRNFVPAVNFAEAALGRLDKGQGGLIEVFSRQLLRMTGVEVPPEAWQVETLPPHLVMNLRVVDGQGKPLAEGRDLAALQEGLSGKVRRSLAEAPAEEPGLEREGLTGWDFDTLPEEVEVKRHGLVLRGYPALVDRRESVTLKLFESPEAASEVMRAGVRRLFMLEAADKIKYLRKNLPGLQAMCLHYVAVGRCEELKEDLLTAVADAAFLGEAPLPRTREAFEAALEQGRERLVALAQPLAEAVAETLAEYHRISKILKGSIAPQWLPALADVRDQLDHLIYPGFVAATPYPWLLELPRYLKAVEVRLQKLGGAPERDRLQRIALEPLWKAYWARAGGGGRLAPEQARFRWLLEELRVSLFAQGLKTAEKVSVPRLDKLWKEIR